jgi:hypothetical protein
MWNKKKGNVDIKKDFYIFSMRHKSPFVDTEAVTGSFGPLSVI